MIRRTGFFVAFGLIAFAFAAVSAGAASAERDAPAAAYLRVAVIDPEPSLSLTSGEQPVAQACENNGNTTTCVGKGWLAAGLCKLFGGDIVAGDPGGVHLCEYPNSEPA